MKKVFESGKIWTILSALLFFMTCGVFITYAASGSGFFSTKYNTDIMDNKLTASGWNDLMGDLDNLIPEGAIMAFLTNCPYGWYEFTGANGRFLMGATSDIGGWGGKNYITEVPAHRHELYDYWPQLHNNSDLSVGTYTLMGESVTVGSANTDKNLSHRVQTDTDHDTNVPYVYHKTLSAGSTSVDITNPYIKVRYCVKGNYTANEDYCPSGYTKDKPSCTGRWKLGTKKSTYGSFDCRKCVEKSCEEYNSSWQTCGLAPEELVSGIVYTIPQRGNEGNVCVSYGCCIEKQGAPDVPGKCRKPL